MLPHMAQVSHTSNHAWQCRHTHAWGAQSALHQAHSAAASACWFARWPLAALELWHKPACSRWAAVRLLCSLLMQQPCRCRMQLWLQASTPYSGRQWLSWQPPALGEFILQWPLRIDLQNSGHRRATSPMLPVEIPHWCRHAQQCTSCNRHGCPHWLALVQPVAAVTPALSSSGPCWPMTLRSSGGQCSPNAAAMGLRQELRCMRMCMLCTSSPHQCCQHDA
jgi:hypothetical protein